METKINFYTDFKTGQVFDFSRLAEKLETLPDGKLKEKLLADLSHSERTLYRILRNTAQRIFLGRENNKEDNYNTAYSLNIGPDGRGLDSLSLFFTFIFFDGKEEKRDLNGGLIFHGVHKIFEEDKEDFKRLKIKEGIDWNDTGLASISIHT